VSKDAEPLMRMNKHQIRKTEKGHAFSGGQIPLKIRQGIFVRKTRRTTAISMSPSIVRRKNGVYVWPLSVVASCRV
jgi:hypothetical protein